MKGGTDQRLFALSRGACGTFIGNGDFVSAQFAGGKCHVC
jgi:hypothetical protein